LWWIRPQSGRHAIRIESHILQGPSSRLMACMYLGVYQKKSLKSLSLSHYFFAPCIIQHLTSVCVCVCVWIASFFLLIFSPTLFFFLLLLLLLPVVLPFSFPFWWVQKSYVECQRGPNEMTWVFFFFFYFSISQLFFFSFLFVCLFPYFRFVSSFEFSDSQFRVTSVR
jgi:hypothetical protein